jgi:hypothetical protein
VIISLNLFLSDSGLAEFVLVQFHVYPSTPECNSFGLQAEALLEGVISAQLDGATGA